MPPTLVPPPLTLGVPQNASGPISVQAKPASGLMVPIPAAQPPPYLASQTASRVRPIDPWRDRLRAMMFAWGVLLLAAFATPLSLEPKLTFNWNLILEGDGLSRLPPLLLAAIGLLSVIIAGIPMPTAGRGAIAALLGLGGIAVPIALVGAVPPWQQLATMIGTLVIVPALLVRDEYRDSLTARLLVTLGAIGLLLPFAVPQNGAIPLVSVFKELIDVPGLAKVTPALELGVVTIVVMAMLAWLPAPISGAAKFWAWLLILWPLVVYVTPLAIGGTIVDVVTNKPNDALAPWIAGGKDSLGAAYLALASYGLAGVLGRQLE
jgi:hypothetical protein